MFKKIFSSTDLIAYNRTHFTCGLFKTTTSRHAYCCSAIGNIFSTTIIQDLWRQVNHIIATFQHPHTVVKVCLVVDNSTAGPSLRVSMRNNCGICAAHILVEAMLDVRKYSGISYERRHHFLDFHWYLGGLSFTHYSVIPVFY